MQDADDNGRWDEERATSVPMASEDSGTADIVDTFHVAGGTSICSQDELGYLDASFRQSEDDDDDDDDHSSPFFDAAPTAFYEIPPQVQSPPSSDTAAAGFMDTSSVTQRVPAAPRSCSSLSRRIVRLPSDVSNSANEGGPVSGGVTALGNKSFGRPNIETSAPADDDVQTPGVRTSLDAGMATLRRWIRSRSETATATTPSSDSRHAPAAPTQQSQSSLRTFPQEQNQNNQFAMPDDDDCDNVMPDLNLTTSEDMESLINQLGERPGRFPRPPGRNLRERALSEPDAVRIRDYLYQRALNAPNRSMRRRRAHPHNSPSSSQRRRNRRRSRSEVVEDGLESSRPTRLLSRADESLRQSAVATRRASDVEVRNLHSFEIGPDATMINSTGNNPRNDNPNSNTANNNGTAQNPAVPTEDPDPHREARARWIRINRRFQLLITVVALLFSLFLFAILVCWVILTSAYVVSIDKKCDVPLKPYFWFVTLQLILDVFRTDIMRYIFRWEPTSGSGMPCRVVIYNVVYLTYAILVLRLGIEAIFFSEGNTCRRTAPELYQTSAAFVSLAVGAWGTIVLGYLLPFCFVATLLTWNGYSPSADLQSSPNPFGVFSGAAGAPPGCIDQLKTVRLDDFAEGYPAECCICMEVFNDRDVIIETKCKHVFHKQCCKEWLRQATTCPVCRKDIPDAQAAGDDSQEDGNSQPATTNQRAAPNLGYDSAGRSFEHQELREVVSLLRRIRQPIAAQQRSGTMRRRLSESSDSSMTSRDGASSIRSQGFPLAQPGQLSLDIEDGRLSRDYSSS